MEILNDKVSFFDFPGRIAYREDRLFTKKCRREKRDIMFLGEYSHNIDSKNRVSIPAKLRDELGIQVVLTKGIDPCISLYPTEKWQEFCAKLNALPAVETRRVRRFLYAAAFETPVDAQGRVLIAPNLIEYAGLQRAVKVIGVGDHIEIWSEQHWNEENSEEKTENMTSILIKLGL